jgi:hypothetical protein
VKLIASNASTLICLKVGPEDETFILPYMRPEVTSGDIVNLAPYHFYMKTTSDASEDAFSGVTVPLDVEPDEKISKTVVAQSRKRYGTKKAKVEAYMEEIFGSVELNDSKKPSVRRKKAGEKPEDPEDEKPPKGLQGG